MIPELKGKLDGFSLRVPTPDASITDLVAILKKPATKERKGINPFTGLETVFKAKPARKVVKARPVKAAKDAVA